MLTIPVIINNRDLLTWPKAMLEKIKTLDSVGDIIILDNGSTYQPLIDWYNTNPCEIIRVDNLGQTSPWSSGLVNKLGIPYVVTDPDLGIDNLPKDTLTVLSDKLNQVPNLHKIGIKLEFEYIGIESLMYNHLQSYEKHRWDNSRETSGVYTNIHIDTTFALYDVRYHFIGGGSLPEPYMGKHYTWEFSDKQRLDNKEFCYYIDHASSASSYKVYFDFKPIERLTIIGNKYTTDKGTEHYEAHGYTEIYGKYIPESGSYSLLEIGIWHGDSIRMWNEYNPNMILHAIDNDIGVKNYLNNNENVILHIGSQNDTNFLNSVLLVANNLDFVVDDGSHNYIDILTSFITIFHKLKPGALYFIEDLHASNAQRDLLTIDIKKYLEENNIQTEPFTFFCENKLLMIRR